MEPPPRGRGGGGDGGGGGRAERARRRRGGGGAGGGAGRVGGRSRGPSDQRKPGSPGGVRKVPTRSGPEPTHFTTQGGTGFFFAQSGSRPVYQFTPKYP